MPFKSDILEFPEDVNDFGWFGYLFAQKEQKYEGDVLRILFEDTMVLFDQEALYNLLESSFGLELDLKLTMNYMRIEAVKGIVGVVFDMVEAHGGF